ncbi:hypothetical protein KFE25_010373 [Diacronema lutheri]|uniref:ATP-grasp domain-containing protein n=3 Tax=Diacronema lutheri TaxID=2081491 RepID=A0A8J6CCJ3_DIALT|nr:hypothetical protein KFE25_010373 [Diacronema lutheri]
MAKHHFLVVGSNAREHAIARKLKESELCATLSCFAATNNPGIKAECDHFTVGDILDGAAVAKFAREVNATIAVVGPEGPLEAGVADALWAIGVKCVGPKQHLAQLESSKAFTRDLLIKNGIGACPKYKVATSLDECRRFFAALPPLGYVVKADGLCGGKGVKVGGEHLLTDDESLAFCAELLAAGGDSPRVVLEEKLIGQEFSLMSFCDGEACAHIPPIQDHKRAHEGDKGPNTGGMGTYSGANRTLPFLAHADIAHAQAINEAVGRALRRTCGEPYKGILYGGFMATARGVYVIEYNARLGDPEAMNALALLDSDFGAICEGIADGSLATVDVRFSNLASCCVYAVPDGYPAAGVKGAPIDLSALTPEQHRTLYFASVDERVGGELVTCGSRAIGSCVCAPTLDEASALATAPLAAMKGALWFRRDIGTEGPVRSRVGSMIAHRRAAPRPGCVKLAVLGSTRGSALQPVLEAIASGELNACIELVVSNKRDAPILARAEGHGLRSAHLPAPKDCSREDYDRALSVLLEASGAQLILAVGWMRILSPWFTARWERRILNVHPSLLPDFGGGMDLAVHEAVLASGAARSGATIHYIDETVDGGEIVMQEAVAVGAGETAASLKAKVQPLEGKLFVHAIQRLQRNQQLLPAPIGAPPPPVGAPLAHASADAGADGDGDGRSPITYAQAGVDIDAGDELVQRIKPACKRTHRPGCHGAVGGFGGLFDLQAAGYSPTALLCAGTDGVGTKLMIAQAAGFHDGIGIDLVAMCVNDLVVQGAEPLFFLDYFATGKLSVDAGVAIVSSIAKGCEEAGCALIGGETAEMPGMYGPGHYDLAGFAVGAVERRDVLPRLEQMSAGDVLIGVASSGIHSNGYSLVRKLVFDVSGLTWGGPAPWEAKAMSVSASLLTPTKIYVKSCLPLVKEGMVKGMAHITGGGLLENIPRSLPDSLAASIELGTWPLPPVFAWLAKTGRLDTRELARTFNCGIGMVLVTAPSNAQHVLDSMARAGEVCYAIGTLMPRGETPVVLNNKDAWGLN